MTHLPKLENLTSQELLSLIASLNNGPQNFTEETADYLSNLTEIQALQTNNLSHTLDAETNSQQAFTDAVEAQNEEMQKEYKEQAELQSRTSGIPSWLSGIISAFTCLVSIATLDPVLIGMTVTTTALQQSGALQKMIDAVSHGNTSAALGFEFGFAFTEALICGGASMAGGASTWTNFAQNTFSYLGQTLMGDNFWNDFFKGPVGLSDNDAMLAGMFVGMGVAIGFSFASGENKLAQLMQGKIASRFGDKALTYLRYFSQGMHFGQNVFQLAAAGLTFEQGAAYKTLADFDRNVMAPAESQLNLLQNLGSQWTTIIETTQATLGNIADFAVQETQAASSLAHIFKAPN